MRKAPRPSATPNLRQRMMAAISDNRTSRIAALSGWAKVQNTFERM